MALGEIMDGKTTTMLAIGVAIALCAGLVLGYGFHAVPPASSNSTNDHRLIIGVTDNVTTLELSKGAIFTIRLDENPTTGYSWNASTSTGLKVLNSTYVGGGNMLGAGGVHEWTIEASGSGAQSFNATYERPWEKFGNETQYQLIVNVA